MANLPLAFAELLAGGLLITAGATGDTLENIIAGDIQLQPFGASSSTPSTRPSSTGASTPTDSSGAPSVAGQVTSQDLASIGASHGWSGPQLTAWMKVIQQESGGNPNIVNPSSGAYGIAQFIDGPGEYATYGGSVDSVRGQLVAMANYIAQRYGDPAAAWAHEVSNNWY